MPRAETPFPMLQSAQQSTVVAPLHHDACAGPSPVPQRCSNRLWELCAGTSTARFCAGRQELFWRSEQQPSTVHKVLSNQAILGPAKQAGLLKLLASTSIRPFSSQGLNNS